MTIQNKKCKHCQKLVESAELKRDKKLNESKNEEVCWVCPECGSENTLQVLLS